MGGVVVGGKAESTNKKVLREKVPRIQDPEYISSKHYYRPDDVYDQVPPNYLSRTKIRILRETTSEQTSVPQST